MSKETMWIKKWNATHKQAKRKKKKKENLLFKRIPQKKQAKSTNIWPSILSAVYLVFVFAIVSILHYWKHSVQIIIIIIICRKESQILGFREKENSIFICAGCMFKLIISYYYLKHPYTHTQHLSHHFSGQSKEKTLGFSIKLGFLSFFSLIGLGLV